MLPDSLVIDLVFKASAKPEPEALVDALGGEEIAGARKIIDPDMYDPRFEMQVSPSMPFRRRGERRLLIIDDSVAPLHKDPEKDPVTELDLRPEKERLIALCETGQLRLGRIFGLGVWGDAVLCAADARDLRGIALLHWVLDPSLDVEGKRRASRLGQAEFEEKIAAYEKRLEELDERAILANLPPGVTFERRDELLVVDVLDNDGTWDLRKSMLMEDALAAIDQFSLIPGAPQGGRTPPDKRAAAPKAPQRDEAPAAASARKPEPPAPRAPPAPKGPPLSSGEVNGQLVVIFPRERFDLDIAAAIGKRDWDSVLGSQDLPGAQRDRIFRDGAGFLAPLEFLSEVFVEGKPLSKGEFAEKARAVGEEAMALEVHCPRFGPVLLLEVAGKGRFICSEREEPTKVLELLA